MIELIVDLVFCHAIGDAKSETYLPHAWFNLLMSAPSTTVPRFLGLLLTQCGAVLPKSTWGRNILPLSLLDTAHWVLPRDTFIARAGAAEAFASRAVADNSKPHLDWWVTHMDPIAITASIVDVASAAGYPEMLDWAWAEYMRESGGQVSSFPCSRRAIDGAPNTATLDWWWKKHRQHGAPFVYVTAIHAALVDQKMDLLGWWQQQERWTTTQQQPKADDDDEPTYELTIAVIRRYNPFAAYGSELSATSDANIGDLVLMAEAGNLASLEWWGNMVAQGRCALISLETNDVFSSPLETCAVSDIAILAWWLRMHVQVKLPMPDIRTMLTAATKAGRADTLEWIWTHVVLAGVAEFRHPPILELERNRRAVAAWWFEDERMNSPLTDQPPLAMTLLWKSTPTDTLADLEWWWNLPQDWPDVVAIAIHRPLDSPSVDVLEWAYGQRQPDGCSILIGWGAVFQAAWDGRMFDTLDYLALHHASRVRNLGDLAGTAPSRLEAAVIKGGDKESNDLLEWMYRYADKLPIPPAAIAHVVYRAHRPASQSSPIDPKTMERVQWLVTRTAALGVRVDMASVTHQLCMEFWDDAAPAIRTLEWWATHGGQRSVHVSRSTIEQLLRSASNIGRLAGLRWIVDQLRPGGIVTVDDPTDPELVDKWDQFRRVELLSHLR